MQSLSLSYSYKPITSKVYFENDKLKNLAQLIDAEKYHKIFIISDSKVTLAPDVLKIANNTLSLAIDETAKSMTYLTRLLDFLISNAATKDSLLIAVGGGTLGDLVGTVAMLYMRGIDWVCVPTTFLSQVDAAIGGKVAVNYQSFKNLLGGFYPPKVTIVDYNYLLTLDNKSFNAAIAEIVKYALIYKPELLDFVELNLAKIISKDFNVINDIVKQCIAIKHHFVSNDLQDNNVRQYLNFGHSFAHAIESDSAFKLLHGEAVAWGILMALKASEIYFNLKLPIVRIEKIWQKLNLPCNMSISKDSLQHFLALDKKNRQGKIALILLKAIAEPTVVTIDNIEALLLKLSC